MFIAAVKITTNYQSVHLFVYKLETISNAYPTLNNRGHYDVMFFIRIFLTTDEIEHFFNYWSCELQYLGMQA